MTKLVGFNNLGAAASRNGGGVNHAVTQNSARGPGENITANTSGRAGSSFRQKIGNMFRPSSRTKNHIASSMATLPLSSKAQMATTPMASSSRTITLASMKSEAAAPVGKNVQRIRLKKRSEA